MRPLRSLVDPTRNACRLRVLGRINVSCVDAAHAVRAALDGGAGERRCGGRGSGTQEMACRKSADHNHLLLCACVHEYVVRANAGGLARRGIRK